MSQFPAVSTLLTWEVRVWEKAEHWTFDTTIEAKDEADAYRVFAKEYPKRHYSLRELRRA